MIHEMVFDTVKPGEMRRYTSVLREQAIPLRRRTPVQLLGAWTTDFGVVNQIVLLWAHEDLAAYLHTTDTIRSNAEWKACEESAWSLLSDRTVELLTEARPVLRGSTPESLHELRTYTVSPGAGRRFARELADVLPVREKYHRNFCIWWASAGNLDRVFHLWLYQDLEHRAAVRSKCAQEPDWNAYLTRTALLTLAMHSALLTPLPLHS